ncbi:PEP-CTERM sorting domain-containing protein [uncultured Desulfobacter sp.]|uniref:PEP-CTERM sorting domain-containing protein n=1 Tax=uncultured Desulfobacter sp. TaxID=240139 RepID=UPI0029F4DEF2|nr:PEP-CTERM sorting domain-containing protein [uncultured Desulfobacter sp.]
MKRLFTLVLSMLLLLGVSTSAQALVIFNDWSLNLDTVGEAGLTGQVDNINQILFDGIAYSQTNDTNGDGIPGIGEIGATDGLLASYMYTETPGSPAPTTESWGFEMTFTYSMNSVGIDPATGSNYEHLAAGTTLSGSDAYLQRDGMLYVYIDASADADTTDGSGFSDGTLIAKFALVAGVGGQFSTVTMDGHDDATYELVWALDNVLLDSYGNDLQDSIGTDAASITITDTNFDGDDDANGMYDSTYGSWNPGTQSSTNFIASLNGSGGMGGSAVPEPATILLFGFGLLGVAGISRRKKG